MALKGNHTLLTTYGQSLTQSTAALLGGEDVLHSNPRIEMDWIPLIRQGLPSACLGFILHSTGFTQTKLAQALDIPEHTLARQKRQGLFAPDVSAKIIRLAMVVERAKQVFQGSTAALNWLHRNNPTLYVIPLSLLDTEMGAQRVFEALGQIEQGVFA